MFHYIETFFRKFTAVYLVITYTDFSCGVHTTEQNTLNLTTMNNMHPQLYNRNGLHTQILNIRNYIIKDNNWQAA